jgi:hypothetical protein
MIPPTEGGIARYTNGDQTRFIERFLSKVDTSGKCWVWKAAQDGRGYGEFSVQGVRENAHRVAYALLMR